ncbi:endonuclease/exonuclease/phosphatase family protein [Sphingobacterium cellulitidis]|uniref:Endonuclease n=1 Tax=Sphingobacterium cellulitidis TaxID=1768011 RepID=A0A8H9G670_9SPHI|nr:endonuclease/exonuclease/phosphatase family protein [Sphingobacterium soli]MBA8986042.1 endonuclease/exonuclease/phosphatase (EEP) superfamily protein YafD [Sphingobacterium soli]GGE35189.1 endonuclease [Sphingobacterium soli]
MEITLIIFGCLLIIFTALPLVRKDHWTFRVFEYPRIQKLALSTLWVILYAIHADFENKTLLILLVLIIGIIAYLLKQILPFTPLGKKQVYKAENIDDKNNLKIMISNVYEDNDNYKGCLSVIHLNDPDLVLLLETSHEWDRQTQSLEVDYKYHVKVPIDNTYGMLLYSKYKILNPQVKYLVEDEIPSIHCQLELPSGQKVQVYAVHPTPPVPNENPRSTERDKELLIVAEKAKDCELPVVVIGDLNDVAWSYTTELFLKMSTLLDPRRGRGFYNTFHAKQPLLQFPLDHAFISADFKLRDLRKLDNYNSDHFPIFVHIQFEEQAEDQQEDNQLEADQQDKKEAAEKRNADTSENP